MNTYSNGQRFKAFIEGTPVKGTISVESRRNDEQEVFLCNDHLEGRHCDDKKGHSFSYCIADGSEGELRRNCVTEFQILTEEEYQVYELPRPKKIFGYAFSEDGDEIVFGCGAVRLSKTDIKSFVNALAEYQEINSKEIATRKELRAQIQELEEKEQKLADAFEQRVEELNNQNAGFSNVYDVLEGRNLDASELNIDHLKEWFLAKEQASKTVEA